MSEQRTFTCVCNYCGVTFYGRRPQYNCCGSDECMESRRVARRKSASDAARQRYTPKGIPTSQRTCAYCGNGYTAPCGAAVEILRPCCGEAECKRARDRDRHAAEKAKLQANPKPPCSIDGCATTQWQAGLCRSHYKRKRRAEGLDVRPIIEVQCAACGETVMRTQQWEPGRRSVCGYACRQYLTFGTWPHSDLPASHPARQPNRRAMAAVRLQCAADGTKGKRWYAGWCSLCGDEFVTLQGGVRFCSLRCARRAGRDRRRAAQRAAYVADVNRKAIYERDKWKCQLCGKRIDRNAVVPQYLAATIDHVIPLANGGTHEPANVQAAHYICNVAKGSRETEPVQLSLIG